MKNATNRFNRSDCSDFFNNSCCFTQHNNFNFRKEFQFWYKFKCTVYNVRCTYKNLRSWKCKIHANKQTLEKANIYTYGNDDCTDVETQYCFSSWNLYYYDNCKRSHIEHMHFLRMWIKTRGLFFQRELVEHWAANAPHYFILNIGEGHWNLLSAELRTRFGSSGKRKKKCMKKW